MKSTNEPRVIVKLGGITPEQARDIRARAWAFVFECFDHHEKEAVSGRGGEDDASDEFTHEERSRA
jgi:hypothetical protein